MKKTFTLIFFLLSQVAFSQNLVPNPSFEDTVACPQLPGQIDFAVGWSSYGVTPDYFNVCSTSGVVGIPVNSWGNQSPLDGNAYTGFRPYASNQPNTREFLGRQLSQQLAIGQKYFITFYVSLADTFSLDCAVNKIGLKFSTVPFSSTSLPPLNDSAHIHTEAIITDKINWTKISGSFVSDSAYNYLMIGNFYMDANTDTANCPAISYYYLDEVCVSLDSLTCVSPNNVNFLNHNNALLKLEPNPASYILNITSFSETINELEIYTSIGQLIFKHDLSINTKTFNLNVSTFSEGFYYLKILINNNYSIYKILIIH